MGGAPPPSDPGSGGPRGGRLQRVRDERHGRAGMQLRVARVQRLRLAVPGALRPERRVHASPRLRRRHVAEPRPRQLVRVWSIPPHMG